MATNPINPYNNTETMTRLSIRSFNLERILRLKFKDPVLLCTIDKQVSFEQQ